MFQNLSGHKHIIWSSVERSVKYAMTAGLKDSKDSQRAFIPILFSYEWSQTVILLGLLPPTVPLQPVG